MAKKRNIISLVKVLDELKCSVFEMYGREGQKLLANTKKHIASITAARIEKEIGSTVINEWESVNERFSIRCQDDYLQWMNREVDERIKKGTLEVFLAKQSQEECSAWRRLITNWNLIHSAYIALLPAETLTHFDAYCERQYFINKSKTDPYGHPIIANTQEETQADIHSGLQKLILRKKGSLKSAKPAIVFSSLISRKDWLFMLKLLSGEEYLDYQYVDQDALLNEWLVHHLSFNQYDMNFPQAGSLKLKWNGQLMALAEWLMLLRKKLIHYSGISNAKLLKWADEAIEYKGDRSKLVHAISKLKNYNAKFFTCDVTAEEFTFSINYNVRLSRKVKT
ncbi:MAG: hypothetical protein RL204_1451 [Bacteroidota bacterium]